MGQGGLEPPTPRLSSVCSNQLSYWPKPCGISRRSLPLSPAPQGGPRTWKDARLAPRLCRRSLAARCRRWRGSGIWVCERRARLLRALAEFGTTRAFARACRFCQDHSQQAPSLELTPRASSLKGGDPAAGSPTATLLRLHPSHEAYRGKRAPCGYPTYFWYPPLPWCDGRCVQDPGTYSPQHADLRLLAIPTSCSRVADYNPDYDRLSEIGFTSRFRYPLYLPLYDV